MNLSFPTFLAAALATTANAWGPNWSSVYTMSNQAENEILVYSRDTASGELAYEKSYSTGGSGLGQIGTAPGDPLGAQDPMVVAGRCLLAVNAGSGTVSSFKILGSRNLELVGVYPTGGQAPVSVAEHDGLVYVLNSWGKGSIKGFHLDTAGFAMQTCVMTPVGDVVELDQPMPAQPPNGLATPTEVGFTPEGNLLVVLKLVGGFETFPDNPGTATLNHYVLEDDGTTSAGALTKTEVGGPGRAGSLPFAFDFDSDTGNLILAEVFHGGAPAEGNGSGGVSTWKLNDDYTYSQISEVTDIGQIFTCWVRFNPMNKCAYSSNAGSEGSISSLTSMGPGSGAGFELVESTAAGLNAPIDLKVDNSGQNLYVLANQAGESSFSSGIPAIHVYSMTSDSCGLTSVQEISDGFDPSFIEANGAVGIAVFPGNAAE